MLHFLCPSAGGPLCVPVAPLSCDLARAALVNLDHVYSQAFFVQSVLAGECLQSVLLSPGKIS